MKKSQVYLVAHDAGGAEILSAWAEKYKDTYSLYYNLKGPAERIFQRDHGAFECTDFQIMKTFKKGDFLFSASSLEANHEREAIAYAKDNHVHSISCLDHWDLFRVRFSQLPDEVWVFDRYGYDLAIEEGFPKEILRIQENPYFEKIIKLGQKYSYLKPTKGRKILYICEPIHRKLQATFKEEAKLYDDELKILSQFLFSMSKYSQEFEQITIRLHPSESVDKYNDILSKYNSVMPIEVSQKRPLVEDVQMHNLIVGIESMGLFVALLLEKKVYSCITGKQFKIALPHREINKLQSFDELLKQ